MIMNEVSIKKFMMIYNALFDNRTIPHTTNVCRNMKYDGKQLVVMEGNKVRFYIL